jgi:hypothetical protein
MKSNSDYPMSTLPLSPPRPSSQLRHVSGLTISTPSNPQETSKPALESKVPRLKWWGPIAASRGGLGRVGPMRPGLRIPSWGGSLFQGRKVWGWGRVGRVDIGRFYSWGILRPVLGLNGVDGAGATRHFHDQNSSVAFPDPRLRVDNSDGIGVCGINVLIVRTERSFATTSNQLVSQPHVPHKAPTTKPFILAKGDIRYVLRLFTILSTWQHGSGLFLVASASLPHGTSIRSPSLVARSHAPEMVVGRLSFWLMERFSQTYGSERRCEEDLRDDL